MRTLVVCSGGLDSVALAHMVAGEQELTRLVSFDYGQRHAKELEFAARCAMRLGVPHELIDVRAVGRVLTGSALTEDIAVPDGHYAEETMRVTVVPNRNAIMLAIAFGIAAARGDNAVATAVHGGDHFIYPDCRPAFTEAFEAMQRTALDGYADVRLFTPFVHRRRSTSYVRARVSGRLLRRHGPAIRAAHSIAGAAARVWSAARPFIWQGSRIPPAMTTRISGAWRSKSGQAPDGGTGLQAAYERSAHCAPARIPLSRMLPVSGEAASFKPEPCSPAGEERLVTGL